MLRFSPVAWILRYARRLRFPQLALLVAAVFVIDLFLPDGLPILDELILGLITVLLGSWRKPRTPSEVEPGEETAP